jgi:tripartite-type tricarboxylate transporter receptor subunit TctC
MAALMGNEIQLLFDSSSSAIGQIRGGRLRGLAIASLARLPALPELPTFDESGLRGFVATLAYGILVPAMTPPAVVNAINRDINAVLKDASYRRQMGDLGVNLLGGTPEQFRAFLVAERRKWSELIQKLGIRAN